MGLRIADAEPWAAPRCVLVLDETLFILDRPGLWLDSLHIQLAVSKFDAFPIGVAAMRGDLLYMSNTVIQGHQDSDMLGLMIQYTRGAFVQGVVNRIVAISTASAPPGCGGTCIQSCIQTRIFPFSYVLCAYCTLPYFIRG